MYLWAAILVALQDKSVTSDIFEAILAMILPETDIQELCTRIGHPKLGFKSGEDAMIRQKLRNVLNPEPEQIDKRI